MMTTRFERMEQVWRLLIASNDEALRAGHDVVDTDHVLLGLLVIGGESAARLRHAGLTLDAGRAAMAQVARDDLASIGILDEAWPTPQPSRYAAESLRFSERAREALEAAHTENDLPVLNAITTDSQGPATRLLEVAGIRTGALAQAGHAIDEEPEREAWTALVEETVPVAAERIWALLTDPRRRPEWDEDVAGITILDDSSFRGIPRIVADSPKFSSAFGFTGAVTTYRVSENSPGEAIAWDAQFPGRGGRLRGRQPFEERLRISLTPIAGGSTRLTIALRSDLRRTGGLLGALERRMSRFQEVRLRLIAQALAQSA